MTATWNIEDAQVWAEEQRSRGVSIAFANGVFDLLHPGHVKLLSRARQMANSLIVAINSDASTKRLKGDLRPILPAEQRAFMLSALKCVDAVMVFEDDTPLRAIMAIRPWVIVKGGDYEAESVVGFQEAKVWGGHVTIISLDENWSTTKLIHKSAKSVI